MTTADQTPKAPNPNDLVEVELKFELTSAAAERLQAGEFAKAKPKQTVSTYFDTPDREALGAGYALRLRQVGQAWVQTVKGGGAAALARFEDERPVEGGALDLDVLKHSPLADAFDLDALAPIFETRVQRRTREVKVGGAVIELALDLGEVVAGAETQPLCELELELKSGDPAALFEEARRLGQGGGLSISLISKAERGYGLAAGGARRPLRFTPPGLSLSGRADEGFRALMFSGLHQLEANTRLLAQRPSLEAVHQARIGLRRMRVYLGAFEAMVADPRRAEIEATLKRLTGIFADARSLDVFIAETFRPYVRDATGAAEFGEALLHAQAKAHEQVRHALADASFAAAMFDLLEWIACGPWTRAATTAAEAERELQGMAAKLLHHRRKVMLKRGAKLDWDDPAARHKLRIQAKKMRYLAEVFAAGFGGGKSFLKALQKLQDRLGALNDIATASDVAHLALGASVSRDASFAAGALIGERRAATSELLSQAQRAYARFADEPPFWPKRR